MRMLSLEIQQSNKDYFAKVWELLTYRYAATTSLTFDTYHPDAHLGQESLNLVTEIIKIAAADTSSPLHRLLPQLACLSSDLAREALRREDVKGYGELDPHMSYDEWLYGGRWFAYEGLAFAQWFLHNTPSSECCKDYWKEAFIAMEQHYDAINVFREDILKCGLPYLVLSTDYSLAVQKYLQHEKRPIDIQEYTRGKLLKKLYALMYLIAEYKLQNEPEELLSTIQKSISYFFVRAQDWRIHSMFAGMITKRMIIAYYHGLFNTGVTDCIALAQGLRGF